MCGRYFIDDEMWREIRKICKQIDDAKLKVTVGDVRPTDMAMVLTGMKNVHLEAMRWGFTSKYQDWLLINARAESILSKPAFRNSVRNCRCVIPAAGFYEWNKEKAKNLFYHAAVRYSLHGRCLAANRKRKPVYDHNNCS